MNLVMKKGLNLSNMK